MYVLCCVLRSVDEELVLDLEQYTESVLTRIIFFLKNDKNVFKALINQNDMTINIVVI